LQTFGGKYEELMKKNMSTLLEEFSEYKATMEAGHCISTKLRINDCIHTFQLITNEVFFLSLETNPI